MTAGVPGEKKMNKKAGFSKFNIFSKKFQRSVVGSVG